jgi:hypothetical protein
MLTAEAHVLTDRPGRYLGQLCRHASHMRHQSRTHASPEVRHVEWSDTHGTVVLDSGRWTLEAARNTLTLRAEAANNEDLQRIQDLLTQRIDKIGRRDHLTVTWQRTGTSAPSDPADVAAERRHGGKPGTAWVLVAVVALFIAVHLGLGGAALAASSWTIWTGIGLAAILLLKIVVLRVLTTRRHSVSAVVGKVFGGRSWTNRP